jgi:hypothetical protein
VITFKKIFGLQGLEEYLLILEVLVLSCGRGSMRALCLELDIKAANYENQMLGRGKTAAKIYSTNDSYVI